MQVPITYCCMIRAVTRDVYVFFCYLMSECNQYIVIQEAVSVFCCWWTSIWSYTLSVKKLRVAISQICLGCVVSKTQKTCIVCLVEIRIKFLFLFIVIVSSSILVRYPTLLHKTIGRKYKDLSRVTTTVVRNGSSYFAHQSGTIRWGDTRQGEKSSQRQLSR